MKTKRKESCKNIHHWSMAADLFKGYCREQDFSEAAGSATAYTGLQRAIEGRAMGGWKRGEREEVVFVLAVLIREVREGRNLLLYSTYSTLLSGECQN